MGAAGQGDVSRRLKAQAAEEGFAACGICAPDAIPEAAGRLAGVRRGRLARADALDGRADGLARLAGGALAGGALGRDAGRGLHAGGRSARRLLARRDRGAVSVYARGRDYHDLVKKRLKRLGRWLVAETGAEIKVFVDTAPVMEKPLAQAAGLGWQGKHTNLVSRELGNWFFLGAIFTTLELPRDARRATTVAARAGPASTPARPARCRRPTGSMPGAASSYLTIEHDGPVDPELRPLLGNRIYGCDDCLAACPWNKFAAMAHEAGYRARAELEAPRLAELAELDDAGFRAAVQRLADQADRPQPLRAQRRLCDRQLRRPGAAAGGAAAGRRTPTRWCATRPPGRWRGSVEALQVGAGERGEARCRGRPRSARARPSAAPVGCRRSRRAPRRPRTAPRGARGRAGGRLRPRRAPPAGRPALRSAAARSAWARASSGAAASERARARSRRRASRPRRRRRGRRAAGGRGPGARRGRPRRARRGRGRGGRRRATGRPASARTAARRPADIARFGFVGEAGQQPRRGGVRAERRQRRRPRRAGPARRRRGAARPRRPRGRRPDRRRRRRRSPRPSGSRRAAGCAATRRSDQARRRRHAG